MIHEHSREDIDIKWNKEEVYKDLAKKPNYWTREMVDAQVFDTVKLKTLNSSEYDKKSMMHYFFPNEYFINSPDLPRVNQLSKNDKIWLLKIYGQEKNMKFSDIKEDVEDDEKKLDTFFSDNKTTIVISVSVLLVIIALIIYFKVKK